MSNTTHRTAERERTHRRHWTFGILTLAAIGAVIAFAVSNSRGTQGAARPANVETNAMGMPIVATPGSATGVGSNGNARNIGRKRPCPG